MKYLSSTFWLVLVFALLASIYLYPGMGPLLRADRTEAMSDGTDPVTLPFIYEQVARVARDTPSHLFYGALPNTVFDAPEGSAAWMPWIEKFLSLSLTPFIPSEQIATALVFILLILNGLSFFALGRAMDWPKALCLTLSICWAFNSFTHARAKVHPAMTALYHLPLIFLGLRLLQKDTKSLKTMGLAALCFLAAACTLHYFILLTAVFTPFLIAFYLLGEKPPGSWKRPLLRLATAALPAVLLLLWCVTHPLPADMQKARALPKTGEHREDQLVHPFVTVFAARPLDYLAGDTGVGDADWNPLRSWITSYTESHLDGGNTHERANGIRWLLLVICAAAGAISMRRKSIAVDAFSRRYYLLFLSMGAFAFWLSLSPVYFGHAWGPFAWLHFAVPQLRVPSRAGIFVHFSALMIVGGFLQAWLFAEGGAEKAHPRLQNKKWRKFLSFPAVLPLWALLSFPPLLNPLPLSKIQPPYSSLTSPDFIDCGTGLYFPYVSGNYGVLEYYYFNQRLRGTHCSALNANETNPRDQLLFRSFPLHPQVIAALQQDNPQFFQALLNFAECTGIQWMVFDSHVPESWKSRFCRALGWERSEADVCRARPPHHPLKKTPEECIQSP
jgi:hypothetical protein